MALKVRGIYRNRTENVRPQGEPDFPRLYEPPPRIVLDRRLAAARISFPKRVIILEAGLKYSALRGMPVVPRLEDVVVDNGEHDIVERFDRLNA